MLKIEDLYGRILTAQQLPEVFKKEAQALPAMRKKQGNYQCQRCGSSVTSATRLPIGAYYCRACLIMGRVRSDEPLYYFPQQAFPPLDALRWQGQLTPYQQQISDALVANYHQGQATLVHAVTGAGKTEMIYAVVAACIQDGGAVGIATPRIDVCLELYKRLSQDFICPISLLHGESEAYFRTPLVIATTHQLLKFRAAFDLLIIDEVDAFPFVDNEQLYYAVDQSLKQTGVKLFSTATSTDELDKQVKKGELHRLRLPRRFHENPLVVPKKVWLQHLERQMTKQKLPLKLIQLIRQQRQAGYPLLIFAPEIMMGQNLTAILSHLLPKEKIGFVSSQTSQRLDLVQAFREGGLNILVSTTILERGVTFPCVDVFVVAANHRLYTKSSLVQISGRVGRSLERPTGQLLFFHDGTNHAIESAIAEIKMMNKESGLG